MFEPVGPINTMRMPLARLVWHRHLESNIHIEEDQQIIFSNNGFWVGELLKHGGKCLIIVML